LGRLTLSMIVRNEENRLRDCLESIKNIADEMVIVDTGSTDQTLEIARQYNAKIYHFDWVNDFSAARNFALSKSTGKWILYLDADERLKADSVPLVSSIINKEEKTGCRCEVISKNSFRNSSQIMRYTRLFFNTPGIKFTGTFHEQIENSLLANNYSLCSPDIQIDHIGYDLSDADIRTKAERNLFYLLKEYSQNSSSYNAYQIGNTYQILNDEQKAYDYYSRTITDELFSAEYKSICYLHMSSYELSMHQLDQAAEYCNKGLIANTYLPQLYLISSEINFRKGNISDACADCLKAYELNRKIINKEHKSSQITTSFDVKKPLYQGLYISISASETEWINRFIILLRQTAPSECELIEKLFSNEIFSEEKRIEFFKIITKDNLQCLLAILGKYEHPDKILFIADYVSENFPENSKVLTFCGKCYSQAGEKQKAKIYYERALEVSVKDPSAAFYLISVLLEMNEFSEIPQIITFIQKEFRQIPEVMNRIIVLQNKLQYFFDSTGQQT